MRVFAGEVASSNSTCSWYRNCLWLLLPYKAPTVDFCLQSLQCERQHQR